MFIVYKTTNLINGKIYIGVHDNNGEGFDGYLGSGLLMLKAIKRHGRENFVRETLHSCEDIETAFLLESELVTEEFIERKNTYNLCTGGKGFSGIGNYTMENKLGIFSDNYTWEMKSERSKNTIANMDEEKRYNMCKAGGLAGGRKSVNNKSGIFSDNYTDEMRSNAGKTGNAKQKELGICRYSSEMQSKLGKIGGPKNKGFIWINDGENQYKYTTKQQELVSVKDFIKENPQYKLGRFSRIPLNLKYGGGFIWYNNGIKNYKYTKKQQETLSITEFMSNNSEYVLGRCRVNFNKQTELNN